MMIKNKIPQAVEKRGITPTELHRKTISLSWPTVLTLSTPDKALYLPRRTALSTLVEIALALGCDVSELFAIEV